MNPDGRVCPLRTCPCLRSMLHMPGRSWASQNLCSAKQIVDLIEMAHAQHSAQNRERMVSYPSQR